MTVLPLLAWLLGATLADAVPSAPKLRGGASFESPERAELCFPSGLRVVAIRRPGTGAAAIATVIGGGRAAESDAYRGAAHLLEHLWFRSRPGGGATVQDRTAGLAVDGATTIDATVYTTIGAVADLDRLLALEAARLTDPLAGIDAAAFEAEKRIVQSELVWRGEHSTRAAARAIEQRLYPVGHPYHGATATLAQVEALTPALVRGYARSVHTPANTTIHIEADLDPAAVRARIEAVFPGSAREGGSSSCAHPVGGELPEVTASDVASVVEAPVWRRQIWTSWSLPSGFWNDDVLARVTVEVLEDHLRRRLRHVPGLRGGAGFTVACDYAPGVWASEATCWIELPDRVAPDQVLHAVRTSLDTLWAGTDQAARLELLAEIRPRLLTDTLAEADRLDAEALRGRALWSHYAEAPDPTGPLVEGALGLGEPTVVAYARKWLTPKRMVAVVVEPGAPTAADGRARASSVRFDTVVPERWTPIPVALPHVVERTLPSGLRVWVSPRPAPIAHTSLTFRGGSAHAPPGVQEVLEHLVVYPLPVSLWDLHARTGVRTSTWFDTHAVHSTTVGAARHLPAQVWALRAKLDAAKMDFSERQAVLDRNFDHTAGAFLELPLMTSAALRLGHLAPESRAALPWWEEIKAARHVREGDVLRFRKALMHPANATAVVTGAGEDADRTVDKYLGTWKATGSATAPAPPPAPPLPARGVYALEADGVLTSVIATCRIPSRSVAHDAARDVLAAVVRRALYLSLREDGHAYAPDAWTADLHEGLGLLQIRVDVPPREAPATLLQVLAVLAEIRRGAPDAAIARGRMDAAGAYGRRTLSAGSLAELLRDAAVAGLTLTEVRAYPERIERVDATAVSALLSECVGHEAVTVVGPGTAALSSTGLVVVDDDWIGRGRRIVDALR